jgi:RecB family endonuclease NucS
MGTYSATNPTDTEQSEEPKDDSGTFSLERDLQRALRLNIEQLEEGLTIVDEGRERTVDSGRIDITAEDKAGTVVVIELKAGEADRNAIGQILSYMGDLGFTGKPVRGILVAREFSANAKSAARAIPNVELKKYSFRFSFEPGGN